MPSDPEIFLAHISRIFGNQYEIHRAEAADGRLPVSVFIYRHVPEPGMITGITYGLSLYEHPDWKAARPEIILSVESLDLAWPCGAAVFAADFRGQKRFSYGDVFTTEQPIASDSKMDGFLVFAPSIIDPSLQSVQMNGYRLHFAQFYPIYRSELDTYQKIGLERFWKHPGFDMYNVRRKPISGTS